MGFISNIRDKNPIIKFLVRFQNSVFYPIVFGIICIISSFNGSNVYVPLLGLLVLSVIFTAIFNDDLKAFIVPFLMIYYSIGTDYKDTFFATHGNIWARFNKIGLLHFLILGLLAVSFFVYKFIASGAFKNIFKKRTSFSLGIALLDIVLIFNGVFSGHWVIKNLLFGALNAAVITIVYFVFIGIFRTTDNFIPYLCKTMVCFGYLVLTQLCILCVNLYANELFYAKDYWGDIIGIDRGKIFLSWGISTIIGAVMSLAIPSAFYLARNNKFSVFFYISAFVFWGSTFLTNTRSAMLCGSIAIIICIVICCTSGKNKIANSITTLSAILIGFFVIKSFVSNTDFNVVSEKICEFFRFNIDSSGRFELWKNGLNNFSANPSLGAGFTYAELSKERPFDNIYSNMYHNIVVEMISSAGIAGLIALIIHVFDIFKMLFKKISGNKTLLLLTPLLVLAMSMFDNFFFYPNIQIIYAVFLAAAEIYTEKKENQILL